MCRASARFSSNLGPRFCGARAASSAASRRRRHVLKDDEYTPSRRISAPISPGLVQRSAASSMRRLSALENCLRRARATTSESVPDANASVADPSASSVALRAPCVAPGSDTFLTAAIVALDELLTVIPTSLLTNLSGIGDARHIGTGGGASSAAEATSRTELVSATMPCLRTSRRFTRRSRANTAGRACGRNSLHAACA